MEIKTYYNKRNPNRYIDVKHTNDRHYMWRQRMSWGIVGITNYIGTKKGGFRRQNKRTIDEVLEDYTLLGTHYFNPNIFVKGGNEI